MDCLVYYKEGDFLLGIELDQGFEEYLEAPGGLFDVRIVHQQTPQVPK